ncbi:MAG: hypothetical protein Q8P90_01050 [bacterium]|nr:hypothetical protein [bacterium]
MKNHLQYIKKYIIFILVFGLVTAGVAYAVSSNRPASYKTVMSYELELINRSATSEYQYGSYYDLKGSEIFAQHLMSLMRSPAVIEDIFRQAGISYEIDNLSRFTNQFRTDQGSAQHFSVTFSRYNRSEAESIATAMTDVLSERVATSQVDDNQKSMFKLRSSEPVILYEEVNVWLAVIVALLAGWLFALALVYLKRYLQSESVSK